MKIFSLILACFFFTFAASAEKAESGAEVFIDYVQRNLSPEEYKQLGSNWENEISNHTEEWLKNEASEFLKMLEEIIGTKGALERIKKLSFSKTMSLGGLDARIQLYGAILGKKEVLNMVKASLDGFDSGDVDQISRVILYINNLLGEDALISMMREDIRPFSKVKFS